MIHGRAQTGFTTVELLIAMFIAVAFLATGHQMYTVIVKDSGDIRQRARASNIAYDYLRRHTDMTPSTCAPSTPINNQALPDSETNLVNVHLTVTYSCPNSAMSSVTKVQVTVRYGTNPEEVSHAVYTLP